MGAADEGGSGSGGVAIDGVLVSEPLEADEDGDSDDETGGREGQTAEDGGVVVDEGGEGCAVAGNEGG